jgi:hypothetical protein
VTVDLLPLLTVLVEQQTKVVKEVHQRSVVQVQVVVVPTHPLAEQVRQIQGAEAEQVVVPMFLVLMQAAVVLRVDMLNA